MRRNSILIGIGISFLASVLLLGSPLQATEARGVSLKLRASEASDAPVVETVELYSKSYALVIGNDNYTNGWPRLTNGVKDAERVAAALREKGFDVTLKRNLDARSLEAAFENFFIERGGDPDARLFVWYAGHGHTNTSGEGYLIPTDGVLEKDRRKFLRTSLSLRRFGEFVRLAESKHVFTVFDSCFAGTIFSVARSSPPPQITRITTRSVRQFLTSGDAGQTVSDDGTFAKLFIDALKGERRADSNGDGYLTASEMGAFLDTSVSNLTRNAQTPRFGALRDPEFNRGDFVFQLASVAPKRKVGRAGGGSADKETVFWQSIEGSRRAADFKDYLARFPNGTFTGIAKRRIEELERKTASLSPPSFTVEALDEMLVALRSANVRELPTASSSKLTTLKVGSAVEVTGRTRFEGKDWYRVAVSGRSAYVFGSLLGYRPPTPVVSAPPKAAPTPKPTPAVGVYPSLSPGKTFRDCADCPEMVVIPSGSFRMGDLSDAGDSDEKPVHDVRIGYSFAVGKYEVTQDEWVAVMGSNPSSFKGGRNPVEKVSWDDAKSFIRKLSAKTGKTYRLLSESEWEYMARAGNSTKYPWGHGIDASKAKFDSRDGTVGVGSYGANAFGVHDTAGNVWEWVEDCWHENYSGAPVDGSAWTSGGECNKRVLRGGSWSSRPRFLRSAYRYWNGVSALRSDSVGFRIARTLSR